MALILLWGCGPSVPVLSPLRHTLLSDGTDETAFSVEFPRGWVEEGASPPLSVDIGTIVSLGKVNDKRVEGIFRAGTWPGTAIFRLDGQEIGEVEVTEGTPLSMQLHIHGSLSEGSGNMGDAVRSAEETGLDVVWWTDHDTAYNNERMYDLGGYDFESGGLETEIENWRPNLSATVQWNRLTNTFELHRSLVNSQSAHSGKYGWHLEGRAPSNKDATVSYELSANNKNNKPLLSAVSFQFAYRKREDDTGGSLLIKIPFSATNAGEVVRKKDGYNSLVFFSSSHDYRGDSDEHTVYEPLPEKGGEWNEVSFDLSSLAEKFFPKMGLDAHAEMLTVAVTADPGTKASFDVDDFQWNQQWVGEDLRRKQIDFLEGMGSEVNQLVGQEVTGLPDEHLNAFGADVPFLPYWERDDWDSYSVTEWIHSFGGLVSLNHIFGTSSDVASEENRLVAVEDAISKYVDNRAYGCDLLEVGYRHRYGELQDFLKVWDALSEDGIYVTGEGSSDRHNGTSWAAGENRFVTWVPVLSGEESELLSRMKRGYAWFGDPFYWKGPVRMALTVPERKATMGEVVIGQHSPINVHFEADPLKEGWMVKAVEKGGGSEQWTVQKKGLFVADHQVDPAKTHFVRFEVYAEEEGILFSNPIYFEDEKTDAIPEWRIP